MTFERAYNLLPLPYGDWTFLLPFPGMSLLLLALALLILVVVILLLYRQKKYPLLRYLMIACLPLWGGFLFIMKVKAWFLWTLSWFYGILILTIIVALINRKALPYVLAFLFAALIQHQGSVLMFMILART